MPPGSFSSLFSGSTDARSATLQNLLIAALVIGGLYIGREVLLPLALAILLAFVLTPPLVFLRRLKVPRVIGVTLLVGASFAVIIGLGWFMSQQVTELAGNLPRYQYTLSKKIDAFRKTTAQSPALEKATETLRRLQEQLEADREDADQQDTQAKRDADARPKPIPVQVIGDDDGILPVYQNVIGTLLPPLATIGIVFLFCVFILMQREDLRDRGIRLVGSSDLQRTTSAMNDAARRLSQYFLRQLLINSLYGVFIGFGLWLIGVPSPAVWGLLAALMRFVPYIGSYIAAAFPLLLAAAVDPGWNTFLMTGGLYLVSEPIMGQVVEPLVYGHGTGLSPIAVVGSTIFWTWLWGPLGLLLAMPITVCLMVLGRHVEGLQFLEVLLGDRPALSPQQSFYQRALTGDAAEATYQAELCLKDQSLQSYLDHVAVGGLQLAQADYQRGALGKDQMVRISDTVEEVVANLGHLAPKRWFSALRGEDPDEREVEREAAEHLDAQEDEEGLAHLLALEENRGLEDAHDLLTVAKDKLPEDWQVETPALCIGGQTRLDEAAAAMLAELLRKRGLGAEALGPEAISAGNITSLQQTKAKLICLSYLGMEQSPAHLRYLIMRLRRILPTECTILVGYWTEETDDSALAEMKLAANADAYVTTLRDAVDYCVDRANEAAGLEPGAKAVSNSKAVKPGSDADKAGEKATGKKSGSKTSPGKTSPGKTSADKVA
ncbi:AI-2 transport protein TqsA [Methyloligella halotolerans]|uniref:AI-2 transport protein TqsA n=1 Tax=Methyloligella halotolerans TaxID=1177755 RepID=A0A1E2S097_9HYPH|nr:AI-2E family transporter [Methyloligella halotolerans]ODA67832.1 AI-2 transport protein TqsA [Methyloligella halotolerans]